MHTRYHGQRQHIIESLDGLLYQLNVLSFFMAPSLLSLGARCFAQLQTSRPRAVDPKRNLRFWYIVLLLFNIGTIWSHAISGVPEGRTVILDFIGMGVEPSKAQLLFLDFTILFLSIILTTISFETSYIASAPAGSTDTLAPSLSPHNAYEPIPGSSHTAHNIETLALELTLAHFVKHIRNPPPPHDDDGSESSLLPMPATSAALPRALRAVLQARARRQNQAQAQAQGQAQAQPGQPSTGGPAPAQGDNVESRRVPGAIDDPD